MRAEPEEVAERELVDALRDGWDLSPATLTSVPVGGGSYHWRVGTSHWVTVDDLDHKGFLGSTRDTVYDALRRAFDTAYSLRANGFVVAPEPDSDGGTLRRLTDRYAVAVFPYVEAPAGTFGDRRTPTERAAVVDVLARLHRAPPGPARVARPEVPERAGLERALADLNRPWSTGPYAEPARRHLAEHATHVRGLLDRFDLLAYRVRHARPVLTHGEPHPGNVVFDGDRVRLVDWDTVALALPERDLWMLDTAEERARYADASGRCVDGTAVDLYRLRWLLDDIASTVHRFRSPHGENADTALAWHWLADSLAAQGVWPYARAIPRRG
jgi:spectinomycin phosphotransferase